MSELVMEARSVRAWGLLSRDEEEQSGGLRRHLDRISLVREASRHGLREEYRGGRSDSSRSRQHRQSNTHNAALPHRPARITLP